MKSRITTAISAHRFITIQRFGEPEPEALVISSGALLEAARFAGVEIRSVAVPTILSCAVKFSFAV
jgi:hypothetical protein